MKSKDSTKMVENESCPKHIFPWLSQNYLKPPNASKLSEGMSNFMQAS